MLTRRSLIASLSVSALAGSFLAQVRPAAADKTVTVGINLPFTGADADSAERIKDGALLAIEDANAKGGVAGYKIEVMLLDDGTATAGQYDPAQAATNARKMVADPSVVAAIGPEMSGSGKAMSPILSEGDLATITPASTNPDITDPRYGELFRPEAQGKIGLCSRRQRRLRRRHRQRLRTTGKERRHQGARPRPARSQGSRLHDDPHQNQAAQPRCHLLWRGGAGRGQTGQAIL